MPSQKSAFSTVQIQKCHRKGGLERNSDSQKQDMLLFIRLSDALLCPMSIAEYDSLLEASESSILNVMTQDSQTGLSVDIPFAKP